MGVAHLESDRFHVFRRGVSAPILECSTHLVVACSLASCIETFCPGQVAVSQAELEQVATGEFHPGYVVLQPLFELTPENIEPAANDGNHLWHFQGSNLFVSSGLADELRALFGGQLEFADGFSLFAG